MNSSRLQWKTENSVEFHIIWKKMHQEFFFNWGNFLILKLKRAVLLAPKRERIPVWGELKVEGKEIAQGRGHCDDERSSQETLVAQICKVTFCRFRKRFFFVFTQRSKVRYLFSSVSFWIWIIWDDHENEPVKATNVCTQSKQTKFNAVVEKAYPEPWNYSSELFPAQKPCLKFQKSAI